MPRTIKVEYLGIEGSGRTVAQARQDAARRAERVIRQQPVVYAYRGHVLAVWATPYGGSYTIAHPDSDGRVNFCTSCADFDDSLQSGIRHLLDIARQEGEYEVPRWVPRGMHRDLVAEWRHQDRFHRAYRDARARGLNDCEAHAAACESAFATA